MGDVGEGLSKKMPVGFIEEKNNGYQPRLGKVKGIESSWIIGNKIQSEKRNKL
jgi:hypothetical protein